VVCGRASLTFSRGAGGWHVPERARVTFSRAGVAAQVNATVVIVATGALERPVPIPGWTMPGVMTAGGAQVLLKESALVPENAVLVGSGPLLYLLAAQMLAAQSPPLAIVDTQRSQNILQAAKHWRSAIRGGHLLRRGLALLASIRRAGIPRYHHASQIQITGKTSVNGVSFDWRGGRIELACSIVLLHEGVVPNTQISRLLDLDHVWDHAQHCFCPVLDQWGQTSRPGVYIAGDGARVRGDEAAKQAGRLSGMDALHKLGVISQAQRDAMSVTPKAVLAKESSARAFLDALYAPPVEVLRPSDDTIICRCESVSAGDIRHYAHLGCLGPNQTKAFGRSGMGPCQGRYCALTVTELLATEHGMSHDEVGSYRIRAPLKPVSLGEVAALDGSDSDS